MAADVDYGAYKSWPQARQDVAPVVGVTFHEVGRSPVQGPDVGDALHLAGAEASAADVICVVHVVPGANAHGVSGSILHTQYTCYPTVTCDI